MHSIITDFLSSLYQITTLNNNISHEDQEKRYTAKRKISIAVTIRKKYFRRVLTGFSRSPSSGSSVELFVIRKVRKQ